jgi:hypothetical protein
MGKSLVTIYSLIMLFYLITGKQGLFIGSGLSSFWGLSRDARHLFAGSSRACMQRACCTPAPCAPAVLVKWKSVGLTALLEREREQQEALIAASGGKASKSRTAGDLERLLVPFDA